MTVLRRPVESAGRSTSFLIAGTVSHVESFFRVARDIVSGRHVPPINRVALDRKSIESVLHYAARHVERAGKTDISLLGLRGETTFAILPSPDYRTFPYFGPVMIAGSGGPEFERYLEQAGEQYALEFPDDDEKMKSFRVAHYLPMQLLLADRRKNSITLSSGVGGFYEVFFNLRGNYEADGLWLRIVAEFLEHPSDGVRIRGLWWHMYDGEDLIIISAPHENIELLAGASVVVRNDHFNLGRYGVYTSEQNSPPLTITSLLRRIPKSRYVTYTFHLEGNSAVIATTMATLRHAPFQVTWSDEGLILYLKPLEFGKSVVEMYPKLSKLYNEPAR